MKCDGCPFTCYSYCEDAYECRVFGDYDEEAEYANLAGDGCRYTEEKLKKILEENELAEIEDLKRMAEYFEKQSIEERDRLGKEIDGIRSECSTEEGWASAKPTFDAMVDKYEMLCLNINGDVVHNENRPRYEVILGFNSGQYWIYDDYLNAYIDAPSEVLNEMAAKIKSLGTEEAERWFFRIVNERTPDWLKDRVHTYYDPDMEI